jgi:copper chaperone NosL
MRNLIRIGLLLACVPAIGCSGDGPPTVRYGQEECAHCRMIVNDDRFAAAVVTPAGEARKFDEICCLIDFLAENPDAGRRAWVRGYRSGQWHDARAAYFAHGPKLQTPMGSGLAAAATKAEADALAAEWGGKVLRFDELAAFLKTSQEGTPTTGGNLP